MIAPSLFTAIVLVLVSLVKAEYDVDKYCQLVKVNTKLPSLEDCQVYYVCLPNQKAFKTTCTKGYVFDKNEKKCVPSGESNCQFGQANPCENKNDVLSYSNKGCNWFNYCVNGQIAYSATCNLGQIFVEAWQNCTYGQCSDHSKNDVKNLCTIMPEGDYFGDFENCAAWHKCEGMKEESGVCQDQLVFNAASGQCLKNEGNMCQRTNNKINTKPSGPPSESCYDVSMAVGDKNICSLYYRCEIYAYVPVKKYHWVPKSCGSYYFDVITKTCTDVYSAKTFPTCDRCQFIRSVKPNYFVNTVDPSCNKYYACKNGRRTGNKIETCKQYEYFNEIEQACDGNEIRWQEYEANEGACQDYDCQESGECYMLSSA